MTAGIVVTDGAGDRYEVVGYQASFTLKSLDRPGSQPLVVDSATLRTLGVEWDGRTLNPAPVLGEEHRP